MTECKTIQKGEHESLPLLIRQAKRLFKRHFEAAVLRHGLTDVQFRVLRRLWCGDGLSLGELARDTSLDGATLTGLVDRLEAKGLVCRQRDTEDRRAVQVFLTPAGKALREHLEAVGQEVERRAVRGMSEEEIRQLHNLLKRVCENLEMEE